MDDAPGDLYIVTGFTMGARADAIAALPQPVVLARFLAQLDAMFGMDATGAFMEGYVHSWADEPYIRGAYSAVTSDAHSDAAAVMAEPHCGAVFFAGEATAGAIDAEKRAEATHFASPIVLHGAYATGSSAACDVARSLGVPVVCAAAAGCGGESASVVDGGGGGGEPDAAAAAAHALSGLSVYSDASSVTAASSSVSGGAARWACGHLKRLTIRGDAAHPAVLLSARGPEPGYATPVIPVSTWR